MPGPDPGGIIVTILIGIAGAFVGGYIVQSLFGGPPMTRVGISSILGATLGAVLLLAVYRLITRRDRESTRLNSSHANISYAVFFFKKKNDDNTSHSLLM